VVWPDTEGDPGEESSVVDQSDEVSFALDRARGIHDTGWLATAPGVTLVVGRNNVGKTRLLRILADTLSSDPKGLIGERGHTVSLRLATNEAEITFSLNDARQLDSYVVGQRPHQQSVGIDTVLGPPSELEYGQDDGQPWVAMSGGGGRTILLPSQHRIGLGHSVLPERDSVTQFLNCTRLVPAERAITETVTVTDQRTVPDGSADSLGQALYYHLNNDTPQYDALLRAVNSMIPEIEKVLTAPRGSQVTISVRDKYAGVLPLGQVGAGVGQLLYLVAAVLFEQPGRLFLIDEPTAHLHPAAERQLATFLQEHAEHRYVCSTHAAAFINAVSPTVTWLVKRDEGGIRVHASDRVQSLRKHLATETGMSPADAVLWDKVVLVEGDVDVNVLPILCAKLGLAVTDAAVELRPLGTGNPDRHLLDVAHEIGVDGGVQVDVFLDGDKRGRSSASGIDYLPVLDVESFLVLDARAVWTGLSVIAQRAAHGGRADIPPWTPPEVEAVLSRLVGEGRKGKKVLIDLCQHFGFEYVPLAHGGLIAEAVDPRHLEAHRAFFERLVSKSPVVEGGETALTGGASTSGG
jgi:predicted ATPase